MSFSSYPEYRLVKATWLSSIPAQWEESRLRFLVYINPPKKTLEGLKDNPLVSFLPMEAIGEDGSIDLTQTRDADDVKNGYTPVKEGDVVIAKITPCFENGKGTLLRGLVNGKGFGTTELVVLRTKGRLDPHFLHYLMRSHPVRKLGESEMYGAGGQKRVPEDFFRNLLIGVPKKKEQQKIAQFLDYQTAKIDRLIERQQGLIELMEEKRQVLISQAVTKGLDHSDPMKDSSIEWLGKIPEHWKLKKLKYVIEFQRGHDLPEEQRISGSIPVVTSGGITSTHIVAKTKGPGIVTGRYGSIGNFYLIESDYWPHNTTLYSRNMWDNDVRYVWYLLQHLSKLFVSESAKSAVSGIHRDDIHRTQVAIPSTISEQKEIADYLDENIAAQ